jgi:hypothetical protein
MSSFKQFDWTAVVRVGVIICSGTSALFAPLLKTYPYLNPRFLIWPDPHSQPDSFTILANIFVGIAMFCLATCLPPMLLMGILANLKINLGKKVLLSLTVLTAMFWPIWAQSQHWALQMRHIEEFDSFHWALAFSGFEAYALASAWISLVIFKKNPFAPDPEGVNLINAPQWFEDALARIAIALFAIAGLCIVLWLISLNVQSFYHRGLYLPVVAAMSFFVGITILIFVKRFIRVVQTDPGS